MSRKQKAKVPKQDRIFMKKAIIKRQDPKVPKQDKIVMKKTIIKRQRPNIIKLIYLAIKALVIFIIKSVKFVFLESFNLVKYFFTGLFLVTDKFFEILLALFFNVFVGMQIFFEYLIKFIGFISKWFYVLFLKYTFREIFIFFSSLVMGLYYVCLAVFYVVPKFFVDLIAKFTAWAKETSKINNERMSHFIKSRPEIIKSYFTNKYNNLALVKYYKNKKERDLEILYIDKSGADAERSAVKQAYEYIARDQNGKLIKGYFSALSKLDTHSYLLDEGYEVYSIKTSKWINFIHGESRYLSKKMKMKDLIFWITQLSTYIKSGIPLTDSVKILAQQNKNRTYKKVYDSIIYELTMGESFSEALKKQGNVFPPLLVNMLKAAEMIGDIEGTLDEMSTYYTEIEDTRKSIISAVTYPCIILVFSLVVICFILIYIIPKFVGIYESSNLEIGGITLFVINASSYLKDYWWVVLLVIVGVLMFFKIIYTYIKAAKTTIQWILMHLPFIGKLLIYKEMNMFAKTFASLNKNNILLTDSMDILSRITNNEIYKMIMYDTVSNLLRGDKMSVSFKDNWAVPQLAYYMITTGESTGELATMLEKVSDYYQKEQKTMVNVAKTFIEPLMIAGLAVVVGGIIVAVIVPMFGLYSQIV